MMMNKMAEMVGAQRLADGLYWGKALSLIEGCSPKSEGCAKCWAAGAAHMRSKQRNPKVRAANEGITDGGRFNGVIRVREDLLSVPYKEPKLTVYEIWTDLWHKKVPYEFQRKTIIAIANNPKHIFIACTKRADIMQQTIAVIYQDLRTRGKREYSIPLPNLITMVTAENQAMADERIPYLLQTESACRAVSVEPLLSNIDFTSIQGTDGVRWDAINKWAFPDGGGQYETPNGIDWITCGAETPVGPRSRKPEFEWIDRIHQQAHEAGIPIFMKNSLKPFYRHTLLPQEFPL